jgi:putative CocE/NonD family hydrolase
MFPRRRGPFLLGSVLTILLADAPARADEPAKKPAEALPASLAGFTDEGTFAIYRNEERLVTMTFSWRPDGSFNEKSTVSLAGQSVSTVLKITPDKDGRWVKASIVSPQGTIALERNGGVVRKTFRGKTETIDLKPETTIFDNFSPSLMSQTVRLYDRTKGGKQKFPLFLMSGVMGESTLERKDVQSRPIGGKDLSFTRYTYSVFGIDITLWVDPGDRVVLAEVPVQHAAFVREGYEILRRAAESDPLLSAAKYEVTTESNIAVPMRDGVKLLTDVYRPRAEGKFPAILIRTPYKKDMTQPQAAYYARRGYAVAVQNCRGRFGSGGTWEPFINEANDGHDAVEWLAVQPWSTGKVGMIGGSYVGWVQWWAASENPPHLVTIIPNVSPPDPFYNIPYEYGVFFLHGAIWWAEVLESEATADLSGATMARIGERKYQSLLRTLPVIDLDTKLLGKENRYWRRWIEHPTNDSYWEPANFLDRLKDVRIPVYHQSGWFDGDGIGSKLNYLRMASFGHRNQKLVLGPWGHTDEAQRRQGSRDFGPEAIRDLQRSYLRWFDRWLKGIDNGIDREPLVSLFVMGSNKWLEGNTYPLPETRFEKWYLASGGQANTSKGDGRLSTEPPATEAAPDRYTYDPGDPTPDPDAYEEPDDSADKTKVKSHEEKKAAAEGHHEQVTSNRRDILVYTSEAFKAPYSFAGPISAVLHASSSAKDTDWFMRLLEVDKAGKLLPFAEGKIRARFRRSMKQPEPLEPEKVYEYQLDLWQTGITIPEGHRLRVEVSSASFPSFSRNLNTGGHNETETEYVKAEQKVYHTQQSPSYVLLPRVELKK